MARAHGLPYHAFRSLEEARAADDGVVILEGDWGGQIYATCPAKRVRCSEQQLSQLLTDLNRIAWPGNEKHGDNDGSAIHYEPRPVGSGVSGGMGGGRVVDGVWVHEEFVELGISDQIREVFEGERERLSTVFDRVLIIMCESKRHLAELLERVTWPCEGAVRVIKVVRRYEEAESEVERLNALGNPDHHYFLMFSSMEPPL